MNRISNRRLTVKLPWLAISALSLAACLSHASAIAQGNFLSLVSGTPPPLTNVNLVVNNSGPGGNGVGQPPDVSGFTTSANFGDLAQVINGLPAQAILGLRVRGDRDYVLTGSQFSFTVVNLQYRGVNLQGSQDRGSFIRVTAGTPAGIGRNSNVGGTNVNGALAGEGLMLSQFSNGGVSAMSTVIMSGASPTAERNRNQGPPGAPANGAPAQQPNQPGMPNRPNEDNAEFAAVEIPLVFWLPTGMALGPVSGSSAGSFVANMQFGVFPRP